MEGKKGCLGGAIFLLIIVGCVVLFLGGLTGSNMISLRNVLGERVIGVIVQQDQSMIAQDDMQRHPNEVQALYKGVDGTCVPKDCRFEWYGVVARDELSANGCGDQIVGVKILAQLYKPKDISAEAGTKVWYNIEGMRAMTNGGCEAGPLHPHPDFDIRAKPKAPNSFDVPTILQTTNCKMRVFFGLEGTDYNCSDSGFYPVGNVTSQGTLPWQANKMVYFVTISAKGIWVYPWDSLPPNLDETGLQGNQALQSLVELYKSMSQAAQQQIQP